MGNMLPPIPTIVQRGTRSREGESFLFGKSVAFDTPIYIARVLFNAPLFRDAHTLSGMAEALAKYADLTLPPQEVTIIALSDVGDRSMALAEVRWKGGVTQMLWVPYNVKERWVGEPSPLKLEEFQ